MLQKHNADCLVAAAGSLALEKVLNQYSGLQQVLWVAERSSRHMEWNEVPEGVGGKAEIAVWHEITDEKGDQRVSSLPASIPEEELPSVFIVSKTPDSSDYSTVAFTQKVKRYSLMLSQMLTEVSESCCRCSRPAFRAPQGSTTWTPRYCLSTRSTDRSICACGRSYSPVLEFILGFNVRRWSKSGVSCRL